MQNNLLKLLVLGACIALGFAISSCAKAEELLIDTGSSPQTACRLVSQIEEAVQTYKAPYNMTVDRITFSARVGSAVLPHNTIVRISIGSTYEQFYTSVLTTTMTNYSVSFAEPQYFNQGDTVTVYFVDLSTQTPPNTNPMLVYRGNSDLYADGVSRCVSPPYGGSNDFDWDLYGRFWNFKSWLSMPWLPTVFASTSCSFITKTKAGADWATTTADCSDPVINVSTASTTQNITNTTQDILGGLFLFIAIVFGSLAIFGYRKS